MAHELDAELILPEEIKVHWTGCPNSCGQAYMGAIGLTGTKARAPNGGQGMVEAYDLSLEGRQGPDAQIGTLHRKGIPGSELKDVLRELLIERFGAQPRSQPKQNSDPFSNFMNWFSNLGENSSPSP